MDASAHRILPRTKPAARSTLLLPGLIVLSLVLTGINLASQLPLSEWGAAFFAPSVEAMPQILVHFAFLPRTVVSILAGAALGLAGCVLQQVLRNPLASPDTVGISAGAYLALALATLFFPAALVNGREWIALGGSGVALAAVFALSWRQGLSPLSVVLAGLVVGLYCGSIAAVLVLLRHEWLQSLFIWGAGTLGQQDWKTVQWIAPRLAILALAIMLMRRPFELLGLDDDSSRSLGLSLNVYRAAALAVASALTALVVSSVGVIGFIGLAAPALARIAGARRFGQRLLMAPLLGASLLWFVDQFVQLWVGTDGDPLPTGAITALLGAPLLLWLLPRLAPGLERPALAASKIGRRMHPHRLTIALGVGALVLIGLALTYGPGPDGWVFSFGEQFDALTAWRLPRILAAAAAGGMLAVAGLLMQRMTGNAMASPEVLGTGAGAAFGMLAALFVISEPGRPLQLLAATTGSFLALVIVLAMGRRSAYAPERFLLAGVALAALFDALIVILTASGDPRAILLMTWYSGSTYGVDLHQALLTLAVAVLLLALSPLYKRWLDIMPLGGAVATGLGIDVSKSRLAILLLTASLTAASTLIVGPLTFIGLMAPHLATRLGARRAMPQLIAAALVGVVLMVAADWIGRTAIFPRQIPAGIVATLIGGPMLMWLLSRR